MRVELLHKEEQYTINEYVQYGRRNQNGGILYVEDENTIEVINILTGEKHKVSVDALLGNK